MKEKNDYCTMKDHCPPQKRIYVQQNETLLCNVSTKEKNDYCSTKDNIIVRHEKNNYYIFFHPKETLTLKCSYKRKNNFAPSKMIFDYDVCQKDSLHKGKMIIAPLAKIYFTHNHIKKNY